MSCAERIPLPDRQPLIILVGATVNQRALICHTASNEALHIVPFAAIDELGARDLMGADVFIAWDDGETISQLRQCLSTAGCWAPIVAICAAPTASQVVRAMKAGAADFVEWPCDVSTLRFSVHAAHEKKEQFLPQRERQIVARHALHKLSPRERQVLAGFAQGMRNKAIAEVLGISDRTVEIHRSNLMDKLQAKNSAEAIRLALEASMPVPLCLCSDDSAAPSSVGNGPFARPTISIVNPPPK